MLEDYTVLPSIKMKDYVNKGDIFLVKELDVPDRWISINFYSQAACTGYPLEISKVELTNYETVANANAVRARVTSLEEDKVNKITDAEESTFAYVRDYGNETAWELDTGEGGITENPIITKRALPKYYKHIYKLNCQWSDAKWRTIQFIFYDRKSSHGDATSMLPNDTPFFGVIISATNTNEKGTFVSVNRSTTTDHIELIGYGLDVYALTEPKFVPEGTADILL
jgi:hypothetical protein